MTDVRRKVLIVDDHPIVRQGLTRMIGQEPDLVVCGEAADVPSAVQATMDLHPDAVVVDLGLEGGDGIDLIKRMRVMFPDMPVLVLTMHDESFYAERALRAGARGYLTKQEASEKVIGALQAVLAGQMYVSDRVSSRLLQRLISGGAGGDLSLVERLSDRELQVFRLIGKGRGTQDIANELNLSVKTIETYRANIKDKLALQDARELVHYAIRWVVSQKDE